MTELQQQLKDGFDEYIETLKNPPTQSDELDIVVDTDVEEIDVEAEAEAVKDWRKAFKSAQKAVEIATKKGKDVVQRQKELDDLILTKPQGALWCNAITDLQQQLKYARKRLNLTTKEAAALLEVSEITFQRWEGQTGFKKPIPFAYWELFLLKTGSHPTHIMIERSPE